jgi:hypothetical protein
LAIEHYPGGLVKGKSPVVGKRLLRAVGLVAEDGEPVSVGFWGRTIATHRIYKVSIPIKGVFRPYIALFDTENVAIAIRMLAKLV